MKRSIEFALVVITVPLWLPAVALIAVLVWFTMGSPVFFIQWRPGLHGKPFRLVKFRTMIREAGRDCDSLADAARLTRFGQFLRATSLDEFPQLWNVLIGQMSLVGPRPLLVDYLPLYTAAQRRRHEVHPGITGWAQINGRNGISWEEKFDLDLWYVEHRSLWLDARILMRTLPRLLDGRGISAVGEPTMPRFAGAAREDSR